MYRENFRFLRRPNNPHLCIFTDTTNLNCLFYDIINNFEMQQLAPSSHYFLPERKILNKCCIFLTSNPRDKSTCKLSNLNIVF